MWKRAALGLFLLGFPAQAVSAAEITGPEFQMPSRNIACLVRQQGFEGGNGFSMQLYCVRYAPRTLAVMLDERGIESYPTDGDQPFSPDATVLKYGWHYANGGFRCKSTKKALRCAHPKYGAFVLSRNGFSKLAAPQ